MMYVLIAAFSAALFLYGSYRSWQRARQRSLESYSARRR